MTVNNATGQEMEACPCDQFANFAFDGASGGTGDILAQESHSGRWARTYSVKARWAATGSDVNLRVDEWSFTVEKAKVS